MSPTNPYKGVYWSRLNRQWVAYKDTKNRTRKGNFLGSFDFVDDAIICRKKYEIRLQSKQA